MRHPAATTKSSSHPTTSAPPKLSAPMISTATPEGVSGMRCDTRSRNPDTANQSAFAGHVWKFNRFEQLLDETVRLDTFEL